MADQAKLRKRLEALLKRPENQKCADCSRRGSEYAFYSEHHDIECHGRGEMGVG